MSLSAPNSEVDICNLALIQLKEDLVSQIDPPTSNTEQLCVVLYHQVRRQTLRSHVWNFAIKRTTITPDTGNVPLFGFTHAYQKPIDFVRYIARYDELGFTISPDDYAIEGDHMLFNNLSTSTTAIKLIYLCDHIEVARWDALFIELFALNLAIALAPKFQAGNERRIGTLIKQQREILATATAVDGQERPPQRIQTSKFLLARRGTGLGITADKYTRFS